jgi:Ca2+-binding RTX toxin-like protein
VRAVVLVLVLVAAWGPATARAAPPNDDFADAFELERIDERFYFPGTNVNATKETGEPNHAGNPGGKSVWWTWTAPPDGSIPHAAFTVGDEFGSGFDTLIAVYTGASVDALTEIASNDEAPPTEDFFDPSAVSFATTPGETYRIAVDGFLGKSGRYFLNAHESPVNDNFAGAIALTGGAGTHLGELEGATVEAGESVFVGRTVWYSWTPPVDGTYKFSTAGSPADVLVDVWEGTTVENLDFVAFAQGDPDRGGSAIWVPVVEAEASRTYMIQVSDLSDVFGTSPRARLTWGPLLLGTPGDDVLTGTAAGEEIRGFGGDDVIAGGGGADQVFGGAGDDRLAGGAGNDLVFDLKGLDILRGGSGNDALNARDRSGGDRIQGEAGNDACRADRGDRRRGCP